MSGTQAATLWNIGATGGAMLIGGDASTNYNYGVEGSAIAPDESKVQRNNVGVIGGGFANMGGGANPAHPGNFGGYFHAAGSDVANTGVLGQAYTDATANYGGRFYASQSQTSNIGVYAWCPVQSGGFPSNTAVWAEGDVFTSGLWQGSDAMFKTDVEPLDDPLTKVLQLRPKSYFMDTVNFAGMSFSSDPQTGLIADSVENIIPELVKMKTRPAMLDSMGNVVEQEVTFRALNYTGLIPYLIGALQEQNSTITQMQT